MMHKKNWQISLLLLVLGNHDAVAQTGIAFKQTLSPTINWLHYGLTIAALLVIIVMIAKKQRLTVTQTTLCQVVEKKSLSNKTTLYIIDYQQQRFLLADNEHALALQPLAHEVALLHD